ncbi:hypothetical protein E5D57_000597 [Metarhizium anisopliae]|nr:hypothetical protein E5D57_000597 [Metarhizium anisopliae]
MMRSIGVGEECGTVGDSRHVWAKKGKGKSKKESRGRVERKSEEEEHGVGEEQRHGKEEWETSKHGFTQSVLRYGAGGPGQDQDGRGGLGAWDMEAWAWPAGRQGDRLTGWAKGHGDGHIN